MTGMRALARSALAVLVPLLLTVGVAGAATPPGPRLAVVKVTWNPERARLITVDQDGGAAARLAGGQENGPFSLFGFGPISWRPDGAEVAVTGIGEFFLARADGGGLRPINVASAERPVFAPDGHTIAFTRYGPSEAEAAIWAIDLNTWEQRRLTPSRRGLAYVATSFSPDGTTLLASRTHERRGDRAEAVALDLSSGRVTRVLREGFQATYSPDGSKIAFMRLVGRREISDLFVLDVASGAVRRLTRTRPGYELFPTWDPSGERIAFARFRGYHFEWANSIVQVNADGSCETEVIPPRRRTLLYGPAWQPGPGREAGRIECGRAAAAGRSG